MSEFNISVDLSGVLDALQVQINDAIFPKISQAVSAIAAQAQQDWKSGIYKAKLWEGEKTTYINSVEMKMTGNFSAVVWSDYKYAEEIETGRPARDLKKMLDTSLKVRMSKKGKRYLIIPFRHSTPGNTAHGQDMAVDIHKIVSSDNFAKSTVTGTGQRLSGTGAMDIKSRKLLTVKQSSYKWGDRLPNGLTAKIKPFHSNAPTDSMVRMQTSSGGQKSSAYMTFRVMVEGSPKWIIPPRPGQYIVKAVVDRIQPLANKVIDAAVAKELSS